MSGVDVVIHGKLTAELTVPCARCLEPAHVSIDEDLTVLAVPRASVRAAEEKSAESEDSGDADIVPYDGDVVALDDLVRDELLLGIPMIPLCSEGCPGIRPES
jgi:uncharacterized protein